MVLAVGAKPKGQASLFTPVFITISLCRPKVESGFSVNAINGAPKRLKLGIRIVISPVSPLLEMAKITSFLVTIPRSPCIASTGCKKSAGVPVLFKVATIFRPIIPDFPIPVTITRPSALSIVFTASAKSGPSLSTTPKMPSASICNTSLALFNI